MPMASLLASKARVLNLIVFAKHRLKAKISVSSAFSVIKFLRDLRALRGKKLFLIGVNPRLT